VAVLRPNREPLAEWGVDRGIIENNDIVIGAYGGNWTASQELIVTGYTADGQILARWELEELPTSFSAGPDDKVTLYSKGAMCYSLTPMAGSSLPTQD
jgi:hypothetical protein